MPHVAVVGHVEWIEFARVPHVPQPGEIVHVSEWWEEVGGGGAVAAVQLVKLAGDGERTITVLGDRIVAHGDDDLPWERLDAADSVYFSGGDVGALGQAR